MPLCIPVGETSGRTYINTRAAELTARFEQRMPEGLADTCFTAATDKIDHRFALVIFADSYTAAAENAEIQIAIHKRFGTLYRTLVVNGRHWQLRQAQIVGQHTHFTDVLVVTGMTPSSATGPFRVRPEQFTLLAPAAHKTCTGMLEHHQSKNIPAQILQRFGICLYNHPLGCRSRTGSRISAHSFYFDHTQPACAERRQTRMRTQMGN